MFRFASAARAASRAGARRTYATAQPIARKSDLPWAVVSLAVTVPTIFYLTSPPSDDHGSGHHGTKNAKPAQTVEDASNSAHAIPEKVAAAAARPSKAGTAEVEQEKETAAGAEKEEETPEEAEAKGEADVPVGTVKTSEKGKMDGAALPAEDLKHDPTPGPKSVAEAGKASQQAHQAAKAEEKKEKEEDKSEEKSDDE